MVAIQVKDYSDPFGDKLRLQRRKTVGYTTAEDLNSYAGLLQLDGHYVESEQHLRQVLELFPNDEQAKYLLSLIHLRRGEYSTGFELFEHRFAVYTENKLFTGLSRWHGEPTDKTVIIWREQGNGDTLMMMRWWKEIERRAPNAVLMVEPEFKELFRHNGVKHITAAVGGDPETTLQCPLMSVPHELKLSHQISGAPYLKASKGKFTDLARANDNKIGFCWAGNRDFENDAMRSLPDDVRDKIGDLDNFLSLMPQHTKAKSWSDTAAIIAELPLVISVDTSVAHLAGALGVPTWLLLPYNNDWRWGESGRRTRWYDSMWLFRCPKHGDWKAVVDELTAALRCRREQHR